MTVKEFKEIINAIDEKYNDFEIKNLYAEKSIQIFDFKQETEIDTLDNKYYIRIV